MRYLLAITILSVLIGCISDNEVELNPDILADYLAINANGSTEELIACAGGKPGGLLATDPSATSVFYYPIAGATNIQYFEAENLADSLDYSKYVKVELDTSPVFNGYLGKFNHQFEGEPIGIVTYETPGNVHVSDPIRLKANVKPTEVNNMLGSVMENGLSPSFTWQDGQIDENVIYFQVISDEENNLISGTYTFEHQFEFYNLSNVVLNISQESPTPMLEPNNTYTFTLMGISEDNWVNLFYQTDFRTDQ